MNTPSAITFEDNPPTELSNLYPRTIQLQQTYWPSVEHYYQAQRFSDPQTQAIIRQALTPAAARTLGKTCTAQTRVNWSQTRNDVMYKALYAKFKQNKDLKQYLLATGEAELQYIALNDTYWGTGANGRGHNHLGQLLIKLRQKLRLIETLRAQAEIDTPWMSIQKEVWVPTAYGTLCFNIYMDNKGKEHLAIRFGEITPEQPVITRIHSECITGDLFKSFKCDCGDQLEHALHTMQQAAEQGTGGLLLYMRDEGRGIGLGNKLRAYQYQAAGLDTNEANEVLGLPADARTYQLPAAILKDLGITQVRLMTNNPEKIQGLENAGIAVIRQKMHSSENPHNAHYLHTKNQQMGHDITIR